MATVGRKVAYVGPCWAYVGPSWASEASWKLNPSRIWPKMRPRWAKMGQDEAKRGQDEAKMGPMLAVMLLRLCETCFLKNERFA